VDLDTISLFHERSIVRKLKNMLNFIINKRIINIYREDSKLEVRNYYNRKYQNETNIATR